MSTETKETVETISPREAVHALLEEIETNGFSRMIDLDPYFGTVEIPLQNEIELLASTYPEDFAFFKTFLDDLQEEIEIHFEVTDLYEDEEFDQFVEDCRVIKDRYSRNFEEKHLKTLRAFAGKIG